MLQKVVWYLDSFLFVSGLLSKREFFYFLSLAKLKRAYYNEDASVLQYRNNTAAPLRFNLFSLFAGPFLERKHEFKSPFGIVMHRYGATHSLDGVLDDR